MWPLVLIGIGLMLLFQRSRAGLPADDQGRVVEGTLNESAVFGGGKRNIATHDFKGGTISAVFGGFEIDLRKAQMAGNCATLQIDAVFGGVELKIPETWSVEVAGTGVFGGWSDSTVQPHPDNPGYKRLIVKGSAVFGGVEIKN
jgi:hypothetical protein